jgi:hypothetical protein
MLGKIIGIILLWEIVIKPFFKWMGKFIVYYFENEM